MRAVYVIIFLVAAAALLIFAQAEQQGGLSSYIGTTHWRVEVTEDESGCGGGAYTSVQDVAITHNMASADVSDWAHGPMRGTFSGNTLSFSSRVVPDPPGSSTLSSFNLVFSPDCNSFSGTYAWVYSGPDGGCSGTTRLSGTRTDGSGCPSVTPTPEPTEEVTPTPEETPTPEITPEPTPSPTPQCAPVPPPCPAISGTQLQAPPGLASGSQCRGACGGDCPGTCNQMPRQTQCVSDGQGCYYLCTYEVQSCGTNEGCRRHDDCYDACAEHGEMTLPIIGGLCHRSCDLGCFTGNGLNGAYCPLWMFGFGPYDSYMAYSNPVSETGPMQQCP